MSYVFSYVVQPNHKKQIQTHKTCFKGLFKERIWASNVQPCSLECSLDFLNRNVSDFEYCFASHLYSYTFVLGYVQWT